MEHTDKKGGHKILKKCDLPLTAVGVVTDIITELCYLKVTPKGLLLTELAPGVTVEEIKQKTGAPIEVAADLKTMPV
jgi:3-oxoacid CoA-transferase subunit B